MDYNLEISNLIINIANLANAPRKLKVSEESLQKHMFKRHHEKCLTYINKIPEIIENPDFVGRNKKISTRSFECIKRYRADNILVAVKLEKRGEYYYVASMYEVTDAKLNRMEQSNRVKRIDKFPS